VFRWILARVSNLKLLEWINAGLGVGNFFAAAAAVVAMGRDFRAMRRPATVLLMVRLATILSGLTAITAGMLVTGRGPVWGPILVVVWTATTGMWIVTLGSVRRLRDAAERRREAIWRLAEAAERRREAIRRLAEALEGDANDER
jgi:hypothetical protein